MGPTNKIELAPKNGNFVILQDLRSGSWEVGRWAQESSSWVQIDGKPLRLFPTHWAPISSDLAGSTNRSFLVPSKRPHARFIPAFAAAVILISGYAVFHFGFIATGPVDDSSSDKNIGLAAELKQYGERDRENVRNLAAAREEIALLTARENAAQAKMLEVKRIADAEQKKLKEALDENSARVQALERELTSVRESITSAGKPPNAGVVAQDDDSPTGSINRPIEGSNAAPAIKRVVPNKQKNDVTTETPPFSDTRSAPLSAGPDDEVVVGLSRLPPKRPSQSQPTSTTAVTPDNAATHDANALMAQTPLQPKCDVSACTKAYRSFRKSDCTYQPRDGPRRLCQNRVVPSKPSGAPVAAPTSNSKTR